MQEEHKFVLLIARMLEIVKNGSGTREESLTTLQSIIDYTGRRSATIRLVDGAMSIEGYGAPKDVPFVKTFAEGLVAHDIAEVRFGQATPAVDVLLFLKAVSSARLDPVVSARLAGANVHSISVIEGPAFQVVQERRRLGVAQSYDAAMGKRETMAMPSTESAPASPDAPAPATTPAPPVTQAQDDQTKQEAGLDFVPAGEGAAFNQMVELAQASQTTLTAAVRRLKGLADGPELSKGLNAVCAGVVSAVRDARVPEAIDAMIAVIAQEEEETREDVKLRYGVALRRVLQAEVLSPLMALLLDPIYAEDIGTIMKRAGTKGTELLLDLLVQASTFAERRAFMNALAQVEQGMGMVVGMLNHHEWFVVRNVADLVGEMKIEEGVPGLGEAVKHADARVRRSAGLALAKIGTPEAVKHLGTVLHDEDHSIRLEVAKQVGGRGLGALAMPLVTALEEEEDDNIRAEIYRALGRIGSNDAVTALINASKPGGRVIGRRSTTDRLAATEGLVAAGSDRALAALRELSADRDKTVRATARAGIVDIAGRG